MTDQQRTNNDLYEAINLLVYQAACHQRVMEMTMRNMILQTEVQAIALQPLAEIDPRVNELLTDIRVAAEMTLLEVREDSEKLKQFAKSIAD